MNTKAPTLYELRKPAGPPVPLIVSIPHTGTFVPHEIEQTFASDRIRALPMTDWHLHHLYDFLPELGITTLFANYSRFVVDLNRPPDAQSLYPGRFETGLVASKTFQGDAIYSVAPNAENIDSRRLRYHAPYHQCLSELLDECRARFKRAFLVDAHSVASAANLVHPTLSDDIYLGDRDGQSCEPFVSETVASAFTEAGCKVVRNAPYKGGYITDHYGRLPGTQALQIEMCQRLYMDEENPAGALEHAQFARMKRVLRGVFSALITAISDAN